MKIYLPFELNEKQCAIVYDKDTIRVYENNPVENSDINYTDYFINSHYLEKKSTESILTNVPVCLDKNNFTTSYFYRNDFYEILNIFFLILFIGYFIIAKILHSFFLGFR